MISITIAALAALLASNVDAKSYFGHGTHYKAIGKPISACGVPPYKLRDANGKKLPFVALNTNSLWANGAECGRWVKITLGKNCKHGYDQQWSVCNKGWYEADGDTGKVIWGYVSDMCPDENWWCQVDDGHLDISRRYLRQQGLLHNWHGREMTWEYASGPPSHIPMGNGPRVMFKEGSKWVPAWQGFWASLVIYDVRNGIGKVEQFTNGQWVQLQQLSHLGQQYEMKQPTDQEVASKKLQLRIYDVNHNLYSEVTAGWPCTGTYCTRYRDALM